MYPLILKPPIKDYLLGGIKLKTDFGFETDKDIVAEAWMLSCRFISLIVLNGNAIIMWNDGEINAKKGDSIFVPANFKA